MEIFSKDNSKAIKKMVMEHILGLMVIYTKEILVMIWEMVKEKWSGTMVAPTKVSGIKGYRMVKDCTKQKDRSQNTGFLKITFWLNNWSIFHWIRPEEIMKLVIIKAYTIFKSQNSTWIWYHNFLRNENCHNHVLITEKTQVFIKQRLRRWILLK